MGACSSRPKLSPLEEKQKKLREVVDGLGTAKFKVPDVPIKEVMARMAAQDPKLVLLDARSEEERAVSTMPGAITSAEFEEHYEERYQDKDVVAFCTVGYISGAATCEQRRKGRNNVVNMGDGALLAYTLAATAAGNAFPLVKPDGTPTNEVHTFMADLAPLAGDNMVAKTFEDPGAMLNAANARIKETLGL